ncbi:MAG: hypothetical protein GKR94_34745 [Gammaproteobacteria bacterium]|nr:hypothetical protein [Gammaproteobacteria bacterium]
MELWRIDKAVEGLCGDINACIHKVNYEETTESELAYELANCILGSGVRYEISISYASILKEQGMLFYDYILDSDSSAKLEEALSAPAESVTENLVYKRYRYPKKGANYIWHSLSRIYDEFGNIRRLISFYPDPSSLRRALIKICPGIGPKQASHYLKNIGLTNDMAILDRHIMKYLEISGGESICYNNVSKIEKYEEVEERFIELARSFGFPASVVDQALWFIMRALNGRALS